MNQNVVPDHECHSSPSMAFSSIACFFKSLPFLNLYLFSSFIKTISGEAFFLTSKSMFSHRRRIFSFVLSPRCLNVYFVSSTHFFIKATSIARHLYCIVHFFLHSSHTYSVSGSKILRGVFSQEKSL